MPLIRYLIGRAVQRAAADPRVRAKAATVVEKEVLPRARDAARVAGERARTVRDELRDISDEVNPLDDPRGFARRIKRRFIDLED